MSQQQKEIDLAFLRLKNEDYGSEYFYEVCDNFHKFYNIDYMDFFERKGDIIYDLNYKLLDYIEDFTKSLEEKYKNEL